MRSPLHSLLSPNNRACYEPINRIFNGWAMNQRILSVFLITCVLSACQHKASGQTVAVVNDQEITAADLNAELTSSNNASGDPKAARAAALQRLVDRKLLVEQAQSDGIDKSPEF